MSHSVSLAACGWAPLSSSTWISGVATLTRSAWDDCAVWGTPVPQVTNVFGCTLTGASGSTPVTVNSSDVQLMPTADANAWLAAEVEVPGPRSRGNSDTASPTVITLPSSAWRKVIGESDWVASDDPLSVTVRAP